MSNEITIPKTVTTKLRPFWRWWNVGHYTYFRQDRELGNAKTEALVIDANEAEIEKLKMQIRSDSGGRWVPEGEYVRLLKLQQDAYGLSDALIWQAVMSDTPDELNDHAEAILKAHGRVLIHGLGLGCVLNCIRQRPDVTHVDVVEVDENVLNIISPFYKDDPRVEFHLGSCVDIKWPIGTRWNYVWHDIWSTISDSNLRGDAAEHGISYERLHRMFGGRTDSQGSWAFQMAKKMRACHKMMDEIAANWAFRWSLSSAQERLEMLVTATCPATFPMETWRGLIMDEKIRTHMGSEEMYERYEERSQNPLMPEEEAWLIIEDQARRYAMRKVGFKT